MTAKYSSLFPGRFLAALVLLILTVTVATGQRKPRYLLALSKGDHTMAIVDPVALKVLAKVPVGPDPHEVIASSDGKTAYVSNTGGGRSYEINVIDLVARKALPNIDSRPLTGPHGLAFADGKLWFSAEGAKAVGRYDPGLARVDWSMGTGQDRTHMVYVTDDAKKIYTTNVNAGTVSILVDTLLAPPPFAPPGAKPREEWMQTVVAVGKGSEGFDVSPDGKQLWTAASDDGKIYAIDLATKKVISVIDAHVQGANRLAFTPDGNRVLVTTLRSGDLFVFDAQTHQEIKRIAMGKGGAGLLIDPDGSRAFVGCTPDNYVAVIDLRKLEVSGHLDVGANPDGLAWVTGK
jgi:YVTN family beta-propeller protein